MNWPTSFRRTVVACIRIVIVKQQVAEIGPLGERLTVVADIMPNELQPIVGALA